MTIAAFICFFTLIAGWFMAPGTKSEANSEKTAPQPQDLASTAIS